MGTVYFEGFNRIEDKVELEMIDELFESFKSIECIDDNIYDFDIHYIRQITTDLKECAYIFLFSNYNYTFLVSKYPILDLENPK